MSVHAVREYDGKRIVGALLGALEHGSAAPVRVAQVLVDAAAADRAAAVRSALDAAEAGAPWLLRTPRLAAKPDVLLKRRGKGGLVLLDAPWAAVRAWIAEKSAGEHEAGGVRGVLDAFLVEPYVPHSQSEELYVCVRATAQGDEVLFCPRGGVDVGDVDAHAARLLVPDGAACPPVDAVEAALFAPGAHGAGAADSGRASPALAPHRAKVVAAFVRALHAAAVAAHLSYVEVNPLVVVGHQAYVLDMAARVDGAAAYECAGRAWPADLCFPAPFGRRQTAEEAYVASLDARTGASLKLTVLNPAGRVWTMVAGGGASVAYADAVAAAGMAAELANYGEYSGAPSEAQTYEYARTVLELMARGPPVSAPAGAAGKVLLVGGGIANFTNVAATFRGIIRALRGARAALVAHRVAVFVRRGGPNWQEGLRLMRELGDTLGVPLAVHGPETHITAIVPMALAALRGAPAPSGGAPALCRAESAASLVADMAPLEVGFSRVTIGGDSFPAVSNGSLHAQSAGAHDGRAGPPEAAGTASADGPDSSAAPNGDAPRALLGAQTRAIVFGMQQRAVQGMLDFDYACRRARPSVAAVVYPFGGEHALRAYWGTAEVLVPVYASLAAAAAAHPDASVLVTFASCRSAPETVADALAAAPALRAVAVVAEGIPERHARRMAARARAAGVVLIGPATVGGIRAGAFRIGNAGGAIDNVIACRLHRAGSVCYVSKSGGMSNELNNLIARTTDGVLEGIAIGGDRYAGSSFAEHVARFEADPACRLIVLLGEVGGTAEHEVAAAIASGRVRKPVVAWCIGVCAEALAAASGCAEVQFGHAGAVAGSAAETAVAKNAALAAAGAVVPPSFEALPETLAAVYAGLVASGAIVPAPEPAPPRVPVDYAWALELGLVRKPAAFVSSICDDRGAELLYAGVPISDVFRRDLGLGGVLCLLWFRRLLPPWATRFIEAVLMVTADHGPAVSGAHNTIVAARAGKDLVSALASGLLTIGPRFGGALDEAAAQFSAAHDAGQSPADFVSSMRAQNRLIMGIGHRVKSRANPDQRVAILCGLAADSFPATPLLDYARRVEDITTAKKDNLILNVDGATAVLFVDLLRTCGAFSRAEADELVSIGALNGLFVLGRSVGFIGHYLDQRRLKQGLYRHPWDDISYQTGPADHSP